MWTIWAINTEGHRFPGYFGTSDHRLAETVMDRMSSRADVSMVVAEYSPRESAMPRIIIIESGVWAKVRIGG